MGPLIGTAVKYETLPWDVSPAAAYVRAAQQQQGNYKAAISANIADLTVNLPSDVLADAGDASREATRFDAELGGEIAPFSSVLLRTESAASSNIENLTASARAIAEAELPGAKTTANAKAIVANTAAMIAAIRNADNGGNTVAAAILAMHEALMRDVAPKSAGRWRQEQVWIGGGTHGPRGAMFVPPHHSRVLAAIDDLLRFAQRDDIPALPQIALAHAQFETIHPFTDGNGRTGRALIQAMLRRKGLTRNVTVRCWLGYRPTPTPTSLLLRRADRLPRGRHRPDRPPCGRSPMFYCVRAVPMPADLAAALRRERKRQNELQLRLGGPWPGTGHVVVDDLGKPAAPGHRDPRLGRCARRRGTPPRPAARRTTLLRNAHPPERNPRDGDRRVARVHRRTFHAERLHPLQRRRTGRRRGEDGIDLQRGAPVTRNRHGRGSTVCLSTLCREFKVNGSLWVNLRPVP